MKPKQFFFVLIGILVAVVAAGGAGYYFALQTMQTNAKALSLQLAQATAAGERIDELNVLQRQYANEIMPIIPLIDEALPRNKKQSEILAQLQNIATGLGLQITSVSMPSPQGLPTAISQTVKTGNVLTLPISFQLSGSYAQLQSFLDRTENLNRFTNVTNLAITRPDKKKPVVYSISLSAYIKP